MIIGISGKINSGKDTVAAIIQYLIWKNKVEKGEKINLHYTFKDFTNSKFGGNTLSNWQIKKFADKLKDIVCLLIGCTREQLEDREFKEKELGEEWWKYELSWYEHAKVDGVYNTYEEACEELRNFGGSSFDEKDAITTIKLTPRLILQLLGTECGRQIIHPDIWVNALMSEYKGTTYTDVSSDCPRQGVYDVTETDELIYGSIKTDYPNWIITDMRFPNELKAVKDKGGITIRVNRDTEYLKCIEDPVYFVENYIRTNKEEKLELREFDKEFIRKHCKPTKEHESETALDDAEFDYVIDNNGTIEELIKKVKEILIKEKVI